MRCMPLRPVPCRLNWIAKSAPSPTNSMAKATEIGFKAPKRKNPKPAVTTKPIVKVMTTARTRRNERKASQR